MEPVAPVEPVDSQIDSIDILTGQVIDAIGEIGEDLFSSDSVLDDNPFLEDPIIGSSDLTWTITETKSVQIDVALGDEVVISATFEDIVTASSMSEINYETVNTLDNIMEGVIEPVLT